MKRVINFFSSVRLTVTLLALATLLVFFGTLDQVHIGIQGILEAYFKSWIAVWKWPEQWWAYDTLKWFRLPMPGGNTLGLLLIINLIFGQMRYFRYTWKKAGIIAIHIGVILLLLGQAITDRMQREYRMVIEEGSSANFLINGGADYKASELAIIETTDPAKDKVLAIPGGLLKDGYELERPEIPFKVVVHHFYRNADFETGAANPVFTTGVGKTQSLGVKKLDETHAMNAFNLTCADVELVGATESIGRMLVSIAPAPLFRNQRVTVDGREFVVDLRMARRYLDYAIHLENFSYDRYPKTNSPFNFSSDIELTNATTKEQRDYKIWMNHPLRYDGLTFFQADWADGGKITVLQVVENIGKWIPYAAFIILSLGLLFQFFVSLIFFVLKRQKQQAS